MLKSLGQRLGRKVNVFGPEKSDTELRYGDLRSVPGEFLDYAEDQATVMTGFTYDGDPEPADYLKQVAGAALAAEYLDEQGVEVDLKYLVADEQSDAPEEALDRRLEVLENFNQSYLGGEAEIVLQSEISDGETYQKVLEETGERVIEDPEFAETARTAMPPGMRPDQDSHPGELRAGTRYTREEAATVAEMGADFKVGPPPEEHFDTLMRTDEYRELTGGSVVSLLTSPTLPAGKSYSHGSVEPLPEDGEQSYRSLKKQGGVTPYRNSFSRVELGDSREDIEAKLRSAPLDQQADMSAVAEFLEDRNPSGEQELAGQLDSHFDRLEPERGTEDEGKEEKAATSIFSHGEPR
ncbi:MAG: hypothetical protein ABEK01_03220 [Candidatus Nanohaloarchaea archaeon]